MHLRVECCPSRPLRSVQQLWRLLAAEQPDDDLPVEYVERGSRQARVEDDPSCCDASGSPNETAVESPQEIGLGFSQSNGYSIWVGLKRHRQCQKTFLPSLTLPCTPMPLSHHSPYITILQCTTTACSALVQFLGQLIASCDKP